MTLNFNLIMYTHAHDTAIKRCCYHLLIIIYITRATATFIVFMAINYFLFALGSLK